MEYYARSANDRGEKETVRHHLSRTAELCAEYAGVFGCRNEGYVAGEFHDIGKYSDIFEEVLEGRCQGVDHATPGARILSAMLFPKKDGRIDKPEWALVAAVAAHHGILDYDCSGTLERIDEGEEFNKKNKRFSLTKQQIGRAVGIFRDENPPPPRLNTKERFDRCADPQVARMMYVRMLFSSLVDADYSASAEHFDSDYLEKTEEPALNTHVLTAALDGHLKTLRQSSRADAKVNAIRNSVLEQCRQAGREKEGLFTLTAPTGTGKTMAMMAFAAEQLKRGKRRIFFVLPYLSIIDQNAKEYRHIVPRLLEDHSRVELPEELREFSERWTARVIVTTSVRFFESLFAAKSTECRRLHNLANSVILFDEAQTLPVELAQPTLESVALLCDRYDCTAVFSTATQPRFEMLKGMEWWAPKEIISDIDVLFDSTRRVEVSSAVGQSDFLGGDRRKNGTGDECMLYCEFKEACWGAF